MNLTYKGEFVYNIDQKAIFWRIGGVTPMYFLVTPWDGSNTVTECSRGFYLLVSCEFQFCHYQVLPKESHEEVLEDRQLNGLYQERDARSWGQLDDGQGGGGQEEELYAATNLWQGLFLLRHTSLDHTSYLSRAYERGSCKFFLAGVNFYRFNAKNWHFRQILREKVAFFLQM